MTGVQTIRLNAYAQRMTDAPPRRRYTLRRRAERQAETRARILDAALARYGDVGPGRTTISAVAETAGVERLTVYRHFPADGDLVAAAVERLLEVAPLPAMAGWFEERNPRRRLERGLRELFAFYRAAGPALGGVLAEGERAPDVAAALAPLLRPLDELPGALAEGWPTFGEHGRDRLRAAIRHALGHDTWRSLAYAGDLGDEEAVLLLVRLAAVAARPED